MGMRLLTWASEFFHRRCNGRPNEGLSEHFLVSDRDAQSFNQFALAAGAGGCGAVLTSFRVGA